MPDRPERCGVARTIEDTVRATLAGPAWAGVGREVRIDLLTDALCAALHIDSALRRREHLHHRNDTIRRRFDGRNYLALAVEYGLSTRQIRRIVDAPRVERRITRGRY